MAEIPEGFDFTDPDLYAQRVPVAEFAELRRTSGVWWNAQPHNAAGFGDDGYWVVSRHADVKEVSRNSELYSTWENTAIIRFGPDMEREKIDLQRNILINIDPPHHTKLRGIVSRGFTPKAVNSLKDALACRAARIVHAAKETGTGDFVTDVACELPLQAIAELLGIPQDDRHKVFDWSNQMIAYDDPEYSVEPEAASMELLGYSWNLAEERKRCPADDIVTKLVNANVDGGNLGSDEFGFFVLLLAVAGNETTRNAITHGMHAFLENPEQWELYKAERPSTTADEIVRWSTPVVSFQRTATQDTELGGVEIKKGQRVGLFYSSANYDSEVFDAPEKFDITRDPNPHLGFGGTGAHFCVGANLARMEIDLMFNAIADHMPDIRKVGEPRRLRSGWLNGIKEFQVAYK
ncbi:cholest-4-en-3-one 26-monooxygenase [Actinokineospora alba]|uniref:Cholest-4-en-3-one 26-monooxygenase n=1 Tax=Actinokineospora alba TaxID=504798 RepID=A0A1H0UHT3_9PSEU|nr:cholest-4-en-3-one 26-monooxygenase [Actinokineospora alba]SDH53710.1 cholest-4-en-3-one 26-monooxygenase [Actinokineospora alba]SDP65595.1 cholest-4-en-3-one 26-monooxygenase [Actinokineospora alba]